ncbi:uncharacterized protein LOC143903086 isoform X2 [Temnothorax americanus]|uniref:uncharacterized protein LOC143903086 isoform X2 n=1 Tax=Temnothorax americanus TaxID=1964332 RepID=UPI004067F182
MQRRNSQDAVPCTAKNRKRQKGNGRACILCRITILYLRDLRQIVNITLDAAHKLKDSHRFEKNKEQECNIPKCRSMHVKPKKRRHKLKVRASKLIAIKNVRINKQEISVGNDSSSKCINKELDGNELNEADDVENSEFSDNEYDDYDDMMKNDPSGKKLGKAVEVYGPFASGKYDESLIGQVQLKPALYDSRLSAKQRAKKVKADLWKLISNSFGGGDFTPVNASRRWAYLRECYCKARNKLMKQKAAFERSGAAANDDLKSSFRYYETMSFLNELLTYKSIFQ